jgi:hypothetical protein
MSASRQQRPFHKRARSANLKITSRSLTIHQCFAVSFPAIGSRKHSSDLLPDTKEYAITAVHPGGYAECNWLRGDLNLRTHSAREFCLTTRQSILYD